MNISKNSKWIVKKDFPRIKKGEEISIYLPSTMKIIIQRNNDGTLIPLNRKDFENGNIELSPNKKKYYSILQKESKKFDWSRSKKRDEYKKEEALEVWDTYLKYEDDWKRTSDEVLILAKKYKRSFGALNTLCNDRVSYLKHGKLSPLYYRYWNKNKEQYEYIWTKPNLHALRLITWIEEKWGDKKLW